MTKVAFHFNVPNKLDYACLLARKMVRHSIRLVITAAPATLAALDAMLWNLTPPDFVAHCRADAAEELLEASPVVLLEDPHQARHHEVLLNMGDDVPQGYGRFDKLIEVVSAHNEMDRHCARERWRYYIQCGHAIVRHDLVLKPPLSP